MNLFYIVCLCGFLQFSQVINYKFLFPRSVFFFMLLPLACRFFFCLLIVIFVLATISGVSMFVFCFC